jgi:apoptosis-inducing factor 2
VLLCTGQSPNTALVRELLPDAIVPTGPDWGLVRVTRSLQIGVPGPDKEMDDGDVPPTSPSSDSALHDELTDAAAAAAAPPSAEEEAEDVDERADDGRPRLHVPYPHLFCIGDAADAFGALKAGHTAYYQAEVAARNVIRLARAECVSDRIARLREAGARGEGKDCLLEELESERRALVRLEKYVPGAPAIKVSLGMVCSVSPTFTSWSVNLTHAFPVRTSRRIRSTAKWGPSLIARKIWT